jgi:hypothetical protein
MTPQEHRLMVFMLARQQMLIESQLQILRSRELLDEGDEQAFEALTKEAQEIDPSILRRVGEHYAIYAKVLRLEGDLPDGKAHSPKPEGPDR